jgi:hypothetical protein
MKINLNIIVLKLYCNQTNLLMKYYIPLELLALRICVTNAGNILSNNQTVHHIPSVVTLFLLMICNFLFSEIT